MYGLSPVTQEGYATIDLYGEYRFCKKLKGFVDLKNITNKQYFDIPGYNSRRFNFMAGASFLIYKYVPARNKKLSPV